MKYLVLMLALLGQNVHAREWVFDAYLDQQRIGQHAFRLKANGDEKELVSKANFKVKLLFIEAYKYSHTAVEKWDGDCLTRLQAQTSENSEETAVEGERANGAFQLSGPKGAKVLPACAMTFAYWNPKMLEQKRLINPQTGEWQAVDIRRIGTENLKLGKQDVPAQRYKLTGDKLDIDLWYSNAMDWLALQSTTPEGYLIRYRLVQP